MINKLIKGKIVDLKNKIALVTGANGGLGVAIVKEFLENNIGKIYCGVRDTQKAKFLEELSNKIVLIELDLSNHTMLETNMKKIENIDLLINNAGVNSGKRVFDDENSDFTINVQGTLKVTQLLSNKINKDGAIINITSILALCNLPIMGLYCASKSALHSLTQAIRAELSSKSIQVLEVLPGPIDTKMTLDESMPKASPKDIVVEIIKGLQTNQEEVYPDDFSRSIKEGLEKDSKGLEKQFSQSVGAL